MENPRRGSFLYLLKTYGYCREQQGRHTGSDLYRELADNAEHKIISQTREGRVVDLQILDGGIQLILDMTFDSYDEACDFEAQAAGGVMVFSPIPDDSKGEDQ